MRRVKVLTSTLAAALVLGAGGYAVADVLDVVPGVLTRTPEVPPGLATFPKAAALGEAAPAPGPDPAALEAALAPLLADPSLGPDVGVVVRDLRASQVLWARGETEPRVLASVQKILAVPALTPALPLDARMTTKVVAGATPGDIVLVAGGDTLLAAGAGERSAVVGHAGLADLAAEVAAAAPEGPLTLRLDTSYAAGPRSVATWDPDDVTGGFTRGVAQIGLAALRPVEGRVPRAETDADVVEALAEALRAAGRTVTVPTGADLSAAAPPADAEVLGAVESARYVDVIGQALAESDNALLENLVRQAMSRAGVVIPPSGATGDFVVEGLRRIGLPIEGVTLTDACGLSPGQRAPLALVDDLVAAVASGTVRGGDRLLAHLPIAGVSGTLHERFLGEGASSAVGVPRLKTGTLTGVSGLAGTTVTADGALLSVVVLADAVPGGFPGTKAARAALDRFVAALTACGCR